MIKTPEIDRMQLYAYLGRRGKKPSDRVTTQVEQLINLARPYIKAAGEYIIVDRDHLPPRSYFENARKVALAICTIGPELPKITDQYLEEGKLSDGVVLDAIGSVAADQVADQINEMINMKANELGLVPSMRYSPGYCDMGVEDQQIIFDRISSTGVTLTSSNMMIPIKSVSFLVNLGENFVNRCKSCEKRGNCPHRR
ncbi:MAG: hypothetical protein INQ03_02875 [Candidatus Heimdallarchaeota archaeon]|nr:hypothetical protein [Candidatus Heimdallarchaeota archaeon]